MCQTLPSLLSSRDGCRVDPPLPPPHSQPIPHRCFRRIAEAVMVGWRALPGVTLSAAIALRAATCCFEVQAQGTDDLAALRGQVSQLQRQGSYSKAAPIAERYVALALQRHGEDHLEYGTAIALLAFVYSDQARYA